MIKYFKYNSLEQSMFKKYFNMTFIANTRKKLILHSLSTKLVFKSDFAPFVSSCFQSTTR